MSVFRQIADRVVIYPVCVYFLILAGRDSFETVIAVLVSVACVSFCAASGKRMVTGAVCAAYLLASFLAGKAFACFLPSMLYEMCSLLPDHTGSLKKNRERDGGPLGKAVIRVILVAGYAVLSAVCACADFEVFSAGTGEASTIGVLPFVAALLIAAYLAFGTKAFRYVKERLDRQEDAGRGEALRMEKWKENNRQRQDAEVHAATLAERNRIAREIHDNVG
ncbi:MAG: hypothetical protein ILP10_07205, partial [Lachnospiraceae bacterium]|nr:hypothetical protein [Lachnospiraceae bacterium]